MKGQRIGGTAQVQKFKLKMKKSNIPDLDQMALDDMAFFASDMVGNLATDIFKNGLPVPTIAGVSLKRPRLAVYDRFVILESYFTIGKELIGNLVDDVANVAKRGLG